MYDLVIVGGGPAGASAATFAARAGLTTVVVDADKGITRRALINNHLGFPDGITGPDLVDLGRRQAEQAGAEWIEATVASLAATEEGATVITDSGQQIEAREALLALGINLKLATEAGVDVQPGSEPGIQSTIAVDADGRASAPHVWACGTASGSSVHTIITAGDGARVAINIISARNGKRWVDHDVLPAPES